MKDGIFMHNMKKEEKASYTLFIACWVVYALISMTKSTYSASIAAIIHDGLFSKSMAGIINAGFYLFYGAAQIFGARCIDRISPVFFINAALIGTTVSLFAMPLFSSFAAMLIFWSFAGLMQFAIWPATLRIIAEYLLPSHKSRAMVFIAFSYCSGSIVSYLVASAVLKIANWKVLFIFTALLLFAAFVLWGIFAKKSMNILESFKEKVSEKKNAPSVSNKDTWRIVFISGVVFLLVATFIRTMLDAGLKSWVPTMITENYDVSASFASMLTTILVLVNISGVFIVNKLYPLHISNPVTAFALCFVAALPLTMLLLLTGKVHVAVIVFLLTAITTLMYSGHQLINVIIPAQFSHIHMSGSVAAILNAVASFGAVVASFGFGYLADNFGWGVTIASWSVLAFIAAVFCSFAIKLWDKFVKKLRKDMVSQ